MNARLRIVESVPGISEEASGPSYSVVRLCQALIAEGEEVTLAALDLGPLGEAPAFIRTFPVGSGPRRLGRSPAMLRWLTRANRSGEVDVLHNHGMWQMAAVYPGWVARSGKLKLVTSPRGAFSAFAMREGSSLKRLFWPLLQKPSVKRSVCFHATADAEYRDIRALGFRQPVAVIPNGIDIPATVPANASSRRTLLYLGRIHRIKGLDRLLRGWRRVQAEFPEWDLSIAGDDLGYYGSSGYLNELKMQASSLMVERVRFIGNVSGEQKARVIADCEVLILPSYSENFGVAVAEALAAARPAIVSQGAPWGGLVLNKAGWWPANEDDALVDALRSAMRLSREDLARMGGQGRAWMQAEFSWPRIGAMMSRTYRWIVDGGEVPSWVRLD